MELKKITLAAARSDLGNRLPLCALMWLNPEQWEKETSTVLIQLQEFVLCSLKVVIVIDVSKYLDFGDYLVMAVVKCVSLNSWWPGANDTITVEIIGCMVIIVKFSKKYISYY